jgi:hypothetical protein
MAYFNQVTGGDETLASKKIITILIIIAVVIVSLYVIYHLYQMFNKTDLRTVSLLKNVIKVSQTDMKKINDDIIMPPLFHGSEFSYSLWMYIDSYDMTGRPKLIMYSGEDTTFESASPIFYMDPNYNSLHVLVKTKDTPEQKATRKTDRSLDSIHKSTQCDFIRLSIEYVPTQRWINATLVVDNEYVQLFMDGELRKVVDVTETIIIQPNQTNAPPVTCEQRVVSSEIGKSLFTGRKGAQEAIDGYLSKIKFFNYAVTVDHAKMLYNTGPLEQRLLGRLGIPLYGVRNPFYSIEMKAGEKKE